MSPLAIFDLTIWVKTRHHLLTGPPPSPHNTCRCVPFDGVFECTSGVLNIIHGGREAVDFLCDAPDIKAISFVGGNQVTN